ncbi:MAG: response regulator transcription factor [Chloroflexota bacterium]
MHTGHILLIEDDEGIAVSLRDGLQREGYDVMWHDTGGAGIAYAQNHPVQLVILDVRLPDGSGFDFCREMRRLGLHQPIIMLTVQRDEVDKVLGLEMGADDYVTKPFSFRELLSRVKAQFRRAYGEFSAAESNLLYVADLMIDRNRAQVFRGKEVVNLTPTEFRLLVYLAQHPQQVLTRNQIMDGVWGYDLTPESERAINSHIRRLREKIEINPSDPKIIVTVLGVGYRLEQ